MITLVMSIMCQRSPVGYSIPTYKGPPSSCGGYVCLTSWYPTESYSFTQNTMNFSGIVL